MISIQRYIFGNSDRDQFVVPIDSEVVHVGTLDGKLALWVAIQTDIRDTEIRTFEVVGDDWKVEDNAIYTGTVVSNDNVWHIFELVDFEPRHIKPRSITITKEVHQKLYEEYGEGKAYQVNDFIENKDGTVTFNIDENVWNAIMSICKLFDMEPEQVIRQGLNMKNN